MELSRVDDVFGEAMGARNRHLDVSGTERGPIVRRPFLSCNFLSFFVKYELCVAAFARKGRKQKTRKNHAEIGLCMVAHKTVGKEFRTFGARIASNAFAFEPKQRKKKKTMQVVD